MTDPELTIALRNMPAKTVATAVARKVCYLNDRDTKMSVDRHGDAIHYESKRCRETGGENSVHCRIGGELGKAVPGSLEFFLVERYLLYSEISGKLFKG